MRTAVMAAGVLLAATATHAADLPPPTIDAVKAVCAEAEARFAKLGLARPDGPLVLLYKFTYCPPRLTVKAGSTVAFINVDPRTSHSVWFKDAGREESERFFPEERWSARFDTPGEYRYLCGPHWEQEGMVGVLRVEK